MKTLELFKGTIPAFEMLHRPQCDINQTGNALIYQLQRSLKQKYNVIRAPALVEEWKNKKYKRQHGIIGTNSDLTNEEWDDIINIINNHITQTQQYIDMNQKMFKEK